MRKLYEIGYLVNSMVPPVRNISWLQDPKAMHFTELKIK